MWFLKPVRQWLPTSSLPFTSSCTRYMEGGGGPNAWVSTSTFSRAVASLRTTIWDEGSQYSACLEWGWGISCLSLWSWSTCCLYHRHKIWTNHTANFLQIIVRMQPAPQTLGPVTGQSHMTLCIIDRGVIPSGRKHAYCWCGTTPRYGLGGVLPLFAAY